MTILYKHETSMIIEVNVIYVLITKSQGSTTWSDLTGKTRASPISRWLTPTKTPWGRVVEVSTNRLDIINGTNTDDTKVQIYTCEIPPLLTPGINGWESGLGYRLYVRSSLSPSESAYPLARCNQLPNTSESHQSRTNACGTTSSQSTLC